MRNYDSVLFCLGNLLHKTRHSCMLSLLIKIVWENKPLRRDNLNKIITNISRIFFPFKKETLVKRNDSQKGPYIILYYICDDDCCGEDRDRESVMLCFIRKLVDEEVALCCEYISIRIGNLFSLRSTKGAAISLFVNVFWWFFFLKKNLKVFVF